MNEQATHREMQPPAASDGSGGGPRRDVARPDTKGKVAGGPAHESSKPAAWATFYPNGSTASVYAGRQPPHAVPLYRAASLTDEEREAIAWASRMLDDVNRGDPKRAETMRWLLSRTEHCGDSRSACDIDIVSRLRGWRGVHLACLGYLFDEAAGVIDKLRQQLRLADAALHSDAPTLTEAEREAVEICEGACRNMAQNGVAGEAEIAATLRGLLERFGGCR